ncbi:MAG: iron chaperone [Candidatus Dormibacteria bacterium]
MPNKSATPSSGKLSPEERAAMKQRVAELRAEAKRGAQKTEGLQALRESVAKMAPGDRALAERVHATITDAAPELTPKTWYGMPAYTNDDGKVVVSFKNAGKFGQRYSSLEFQDSAHLDDGDLWPVSYAVTKWSTAVETRIRALVKAAVA